MKIKAVIGKVKIKVDVDDIVAALDESGGDEGRVLLENLIERHDVYYAMSPSERLDLFDRLYEEYSIDDPTAIFEDALAEVISRLHGGQVDDALIKLYRIIEPPRDRDQTLQYEKWRKGLHATET